MINYVIPPLGRRKLPDELAQLFRIMRITMLLLVVGCMHLSATTLSQTITLYADKQPITKIFETIEKQTGYQVIYSDRFVKSAKLVTIVAERMPLADFLETVLSREALTYQIKEKTVLIRRLAMTHSKRQEITEFVQQRTVTGKVTDESGQPLTGVTVAVKGTSVAVITNEAGRYQVTIPANGNTLVFTTVGFEAVERTIENLLTIDISMNAAMSDLDEVVVVGYGTQKRSDITGAISSVKVSDLEGVPLRSMDQALQGRVSGVFLIQNSGQPGAGSTIRIRGGNSITGSNEPLYVIDGVPVYVSPNDATSLNPLNTISPADIESMEVLKDASATAIYGSRGGNGVVLITTKRGRAGDVRIDLDINSGFQKELRRYDLLDAKQFETLANEASVAEGGALLFDPALNPVTTDWQGVLFRSSAPLQNYQLSASGGNDTNRFLLTLSYFDQQGIIKSSDMERYSLRFNFDRKVNKRITLGNSLTFSRVNTTRVSSGSLFSMLTTAPNLPIRQPDGTYTQFNNQGLPFNNPVALLNDYKNLNKVMRALGNIYGSIDLAEGLTFRTMWGLDASFMKQDSYLPQTVYDGALVGGNASVSTNQNIIWLNENTLNYTYTAGAHRLEALAGYTQQSSRYEQLGASATGFLNDNTGSNNLGLGNPDQATLPSSGTAGWTILSWIARVNYGFDSRYLLTLTGRYDGSSRFGKNNRWGFFPSAAFAWRAIEEQFIRNLDVFSDLKLRVSHGITGNQDGIGNYPALDLWGGANYVFNDQIAQGITPDQISNQNLRWESTAQTDVGLEMGFFDNRLTLAADVYYKKTYDLLLDVTVPATSGFTSGVKNIGSLENKGLEFSLNAVPINKAFSWNTGFNISFNRNKVLDLGLEEEIIPAGVSTTVLRVDEPLGNFLGYRTRGVFQTIEEVADGAQPSARPGDIRFVDVDGNGVMNALDRQVMGNAQPSFYGGFNNSFSYKGIDFSFFLQFVYGNQLYNQNLVSLENLRGIVNQRSTVLDRWTPDNRNTIIPRASSTRATDDAHDRYVEDGSYLRLKNVQLAYAIPLHHTGFGKTIRILRVYVNTQNLLTFTNYTGMDPETNRYASNNVRQGYDSGAYPTVRTITFGLNASF
ncbi:TonB-dependent receptor [Parapedobacter tibetensis]|uniref:TonB-dependent receptor n=1 Tax=Parapedobacter tibetensis TaxID=2972951 RepID=UPI00214D308B|nr:SusC/RagA family TonB-linked outer membrane protein [Parapedobacter tibetensis]